MSTRVSNRPCLIVAAAFALSRVLFHLLGLRFSTEHVGSMMHFVDPELLRERLGESLLYLHGQPPLMSLWMGGILKCSGDAWPLVMQGLFLLLSLASALLLLHLLRGFGLGDRVATSVAVAFSLLPATLVYENYWFFTCPLVFLLLLLVATFRAALQRPSFARWTGFFLVAAVLVNFKNLFHLGWMVLLVPWALCCSGRGARRVVVFASLLPLLLGGAWYAKNAVVFGRFEASSWMGFGLARKTYHRLPIDTRRELVATGTLDAVAGVAVYGTVEEFAVPLGMPETTGVPILDRARKSSGWPNYHHAIYQDVCRRMRATAWRVVQVLPDLYWADVRRAAAQAFRPATEWGPVATPREQIAGYVDVLEGLLHAPLGVDWLRPWSLLLLLTGIGGLRRMVRWVRVRSVRDGVYLFAAGTTLYVLSIAVLLDTNETHRHRVMVDGLLVWMAAIAIVPGSCSDPPDGAQSALVPPAQT